MTEALNHIEQIVREVLARLDEHPSTVAQLRLSNRVVSLSELEGRLQDVREVVVRNDAVVTPAAKDLLRQNDVLLTRLAKTSTIRNGQLAIGYVETSRETSALVSHLEKGTANVHRIKADNIADTIDALARHVTDHHPALLLTEVTVVGVCMANRQPSVRAAEITTLASLDDAVAQAGVNLIVVNPKAITLTSLCRLVDRFCECWSIDCPSEYKSRLG